MSGGYTQILLSYMIEALGEKETEKILSQFSCPRNADVENFIKKSAIQFSKSAVAATHLVFAPYKGENVLVGYYACANKFIHIDGDVSKSLRKRIAKFGTYNDKLKCYVISAPLLAQFSKNYANGYDKLITGDELMKLALDKVEQVQMQIGGKVVYLECEDHPGLIDFYKSHGFVVFGKRTLTGSERKEMGEYLVQMLRYRK